MLAFILANEIWDYTIKAYFGFAYFIINYRDKDEAYFFRYDENSDSVVRTKSDKTVKELFEKHDEILALYKKG